MAAKILLTTAELREEATRLEKAARDNKDVIANCDSIVNGLLSSWEGTAQTNFRDSWTVKKKAFETMTTEMLDLAKKISAFATKMESAEHTQTNKAYNLRNC